MAALAIVWIVLNITQRWAVTLRRMAFQSLEYCIDGCRAKDAKSTCLMAYIAGATVKSLAGGNRGLFDKREPFHTLFCNYLEKTPENCRHQMGDSIAWEL